MTKHLNQEQLIQYQFHLTSEQQRQRVSEHLSQCPSCRDQLEQLKQKFAALDLLRDEPQVSEELLARTLQERKLPAVHRRGPFYHRTGWLSAVAAVLVVAGGLLVTGHFLRSPQTESVPVPSETDQPVVQREVTEEPVPPLLRDMDNIGKPAVGMIETPAAEGSMAAVHMAEGEKPPFAPASNIELVTLPHRENVQLTIYNSADLTLVREQRNLTMKKGWNWLQFMWSNTLIDPTSLTLEPQAQREQIRVEQLVFPPRLKELGRWLIHSEVSGEVPFTITYFTSGLQWRAFYMGTLAPDETTMHLEGYVRVDNQSGEDYEKAQTRLLVGQIHLFDQIVELARREYPYGTPQIARGRYVGGVGGRSAGGEFLLDEITTLGVDFLGFAVEKKFDGLGKKEIRKEGLSEYFLYTIAGTETIPHNWGKRLPSFDVQDIPVESLYKYDEEQWGRETVRFLRFQNDQEHKLGETPIPNGTVRIYRRADDQGRLGYVDAADIKYIPVGEEVELNLKPNLQVTVEPTRMAVRSENYLFDRNHNISGWDELQTWQVTATNTRHIPVEIEITRGFETAYWELEVTDGLVTWNKHDARHARFILQMEPGEKRIFTYQLRTYHGQREEQLTKKNR